MMFEESSIKERLKQRIAKTLQKEPVLYELLLHVFVYGTAYIVGGFVRDALLNRQTLLPLNESLDDPHPSKFSYALSISEIVLREKPYLVRYSVALSLLTLY